MRSCLEAACEIKSWWVAHGGSSLGTFPASASCRRFFWCPTHMRLYYLTAERCARKVIEERRLKISLFGELNDPFELLPRVLPTRDHRRIAGCGVCGLSWNALDVRRRIELPTFALRI